MPAVRHGIGPALESQRVATVEWWKIGLEVGWEGVRHTPLELTEGTF